MVTFTGIGCGGAGSFLGGVSMVDIRGGAFLSDFGIRAWLGLAVRAGAARRRCRRGGQWMADRSGGADRRRSGQGAITAGAGGSGGQIQVSPRMPISLDAT